MTTIVHTAPGLERDEAFDVFHRVVRHRFDPAAITELSGTAPEPVMGFLDTGFPEEIAIAAGLRPMLVTGDITGGIDTIDEHLDVAAPGRIRHLYEALVTGRHDSCDMLTVTGGDRWIGETLGFLEAYTDVFGAPRVDPVFYLERTRGSYHSHRQYNLHNTRQFVRQLGERAPQAPTEQSLREAIALVNETRELLRGVTGLRAADVPQISGTDAHAITLAAMLMPKKAFNDALRAALAERRKDALDVSRPRIFLSGSSTDHAGFVELIESLGATVVGEDTEFGQRYADTPVEEQADPVEAIADRYTYKFPENWAFGRARRLAWRHRLATEAKPHGVIAVHLRGDAAYGWDYPDYAAGLAGAGIPAIALVDTDYALADRDALAAQITEFLEQLRPVAAARSTTAEEAQA